MPLSVCMTGLGLNNLYSFYWVHHLLMQRVAISPYLFVHHQELTKKFIIYFLSKITLINHIFFLNWSCLLWFKSTQVLFFSASRVSFFIGHLSLSPLFAQFELFWFFVSLDTIIVTFCKALHEATAHLVSFYHLSCLSGIHLHFSLDITNSLAWWTHFAGLL